MTGVDRILRYQHRFVLLPKSDPRLVSLRRFLIICVGIIETLPVGHIGVVEKEGWLD